MLGWEGLGAGDNEENSEVQEASVFGLSFKVKAHWGLERQVSLRL